MRVPSAVVMVSPAGLVVDGLMRTSIVDIAILIIAIIKS
jgi:hypothetical protein